MPGLRYGAVYYLPEGCEDLDEIELPEVIEVESINAEEDGEPYAVFVNCNTLSIDFDDEADHYLEEGEGISRISSEILENLTNTDGAKREIEDFARRNQLTCAASPNWYQVN